jgi:diguanylate cyclase (GGDEF)-like protein/PAS domain S-box-containing protein
MQDLSKPREESSANIDKPNITTIATTSSPVPLSWKTLEESEKNYRFLGEAIMHQVWTTSPDGTMDYINGRALEYLGRTYEKVIGEGWQDAIHPDDLQRCLERRIESLKSGNHYEVEFRLRRADGTYRWHLGRATAGRDADGKIIKWFGTSTDIHEQKLAEDSLQEKNSLLASMFEATADGILVVDLTNTIVTYNRQFLDMWQIPDEIIRSRDRIKTVNYVLSQLKNAEEFTETTKKLILHPEIKNLDVLEFKDGKIYERYSQPRVQNGKIVGRVLSFRDITERRKAEKALQESQMRYLQLFDSNPYPIWVYDFETLEFLAVNKEAVRHYGYTREEFLKMTLKDIRPAEDVPLLLDSVAEISVTEGAAAEETLLTQQFRHQKKDGKIIKVQIASQPVTFGDRQARLVLATDITQAKRAEDDLRRSETELRTLFSAMSDVILIINAEGRYLKVAPTNPELLYRPLEEMLGKTIDEVFPPGIAVLFMDHVSQTISGGKPVNFEYSLNIDGREMFFYATITPLTLDTVLWVARDISNYKRAEESLRESEYKLRTLIESMTEGLVQVNNEEIIEFVNDRICEMSGYEQKELLGKPVDILFEEEERRLVKRINKERLKGVSGQYEIRLRKKSGETLWVLVGGAPIINADGALTGTMGVFTDTSKRKLAEEQLLHDAFHDGLTGLANRSLLMDHMRRTIKRDRGRNGKMYAVLFLDFDRFKVINDSLGHAEGDKLLVFIARRLESCIRAGNLVARLGGDEFVILLDELFEVDDAMRVAERIQENLKIPFELGGNKVFMSVSIGITLSTAGYTKAEDMLRDADIAMYRAKAKGKAQHQVFNFEMQKQAGSQLQFETEIRYALERGEFRIYYQPIYCLETKSLVGFEALIRWQHPERGLVFPAEFIPLAEESGMIIQLGRWTVYESCRQLREWQERNPGKTSGLTVSVNLSGREFLQFDLDEQIAATLASTGLEPRYLKLEITESHIMENSIKAIAIINRLRALGIELCLDDFGTGYSSLSYLHRLPVSYLKIDRSFVNGLKQSSENAEIVLTIIKLAQNLKMKVIAEGVETIEQLDYLKLLNCEYGQGYYFSKQ